MVLGGDVDGVGLWAVEVGVASTLLSGGGGGVSAAAASSTSCSSMVIISWPASFTSLKGTVENVENTPNTYVYPAPIKNRLQNAHLAKRSYKRKISSFCWYKAGKNLQNWRTIKWIYKKHQTRDWKITPIICLLFFWKYKTPVTPKSNKSS